MMLAGYGLVDGDADENQSLVGKDSHLQAVRELYAR